MCRYEVSLSPAHIHQQHHSPAARALVIVGVKREECPTLRDIYITKISGKQHDWLYTVYELYCESKACGKLRRSVELSLDTWQIWKQKNTPEMLHIKSEWY